MRSSTKRREIGGTGRNYTVENRTIIFQGCPASTLAEIFHMKRQNVERRLTDCAVAGTSQKGTPLYHIADAAPFLIRVKLTEAQIMEVMKRGDPRDLPAMSNKMFWEGMIVRRKYEEQASELWHTSDVAAIAASSFNALRMALLLLPDELADNAGLNEQQRRVVQKTIDDSLTGLQDALIDNLEKPSRSRFEPSAEEGEV